MRLASPQAPQAPQVGPLYDRYAKPDRFGLLWRVCIQGIVWRAASAERRFAADGLQLHRGCFAARLTGLAARPTLNDELVPLPQQPIKPSDHLTTTFGVAEMSSLDLNSLTRRGLLVSMMIIVSICVSSCGRSGNVRSACNSEIEKLCAGEARAGQCLRRHMDELSGACKDALMNAPNRGGDQ